MNHEQSAPETVAPMSTIEKESFVRKSYQTMSYREMGRVLGCSGAYVGVMMKRLGLADKKRELSDSYDSVLGNYVDKHYMELRNTDIAEVFGCSASKITKIANKRGMSKKIVWDDEKHNMLKQLYGTMPPRLLAKKLGCSVSRMYKELAAIGVEYRVKPKRQNPKKWGVQHDLVVSEKYPLLTVRQIADELGFSTASVSRSIKKQGLSLYGK